MAIPRRPTRPGTRSRKPGRSGGQGGRPGSREGRGSTGRGSYGVQSKKSNTGLIIGCVVGGVVLLIILAVALSGGDTPVKGNSTKSNSSVDISELRRSGTAKCEEGLRLIQGSDRLMRKSSLSGSEKSKLMSDLERGNALIGEGFAKFERASELTNHEAKFETKRYIEAKKIARRKLLELR